MALLKTIITYDRPSEAEVDKAFLESRGFDVCLLNGNTARNELGAPFYIQLQVNQEDYAEARALLQQLNPRRFGSAERVAEIDRHVKRALLYFLATAIPVGIVVYLFLRQPADVVPARFSRNGHYLIPNLRLAGALIVATIAGWIPVRYLGRKQDRPKTFMS